MPVYDSEWVVSTLEDLANFCDANGLPTSEAAVRDAKLQVQREAVELGTTSRTAVENVVPLRT